MRQPDGRSANFKDILGYKEFLTNLGNPNLINLHLRNVKIFFHTHTRAHTHMENALERRIFKITKLKIYCHPFNTFANQVNYMYISCQLLLSIIKRTFYIQTFNQNNKVLHIN